VHPGESTAPIQIEFGLSGPGGPVGGDEEIRFGGLEVFAAGGGTVGVDLSNNRGKLLF